MPATSNQRPLHIVFGAGISGCAATRWLLQQDKDVLLYDEDAQQLAAPAVQELTPARVQLTVQPTQVQRALSRCRELVVSPGVDRTHPLLNNARKRGINICSEVELGLRAYRGKIAAVTGTNGKSTVSAMLHHILQQLHLPSALCGNIGTAVTEALLPPQSVRFTPDHSRPPMPEPLVVELSSFQLEHTQLPALAVAIFTNFTPSHLVRHDNIATYFALKQKLFAALAPEGRAICDASVHTQLKTFPPNLFMVDGKNGRQDFLPDNNVFHAYTPHDRCNAVMALLAAQKLSGHDLRQLVPHFNSWRGLPYRLQLVGYLDGQAIINDSKATDMAATLAALRAQTTPVQLIFGGTAEEAQLLLAQRKKIAGMLAFGAHSKQLHAQLHTHVLVQPYTHLAAVLAQLQHTHLSVPLLFSPACVSKPEFSNFAERGEFFDDTLGKLAKFKKITPPPH